MIFRYYDPEIGRFLSEDPLGFEAGVNFYTYVNNNPLNFNDPMGLWTFNIGGQLQGGASVGALSSGGVVFGYSDQYGLQFGTYDTKGAGAHGGVSGSWTLEFGWSGNDNIQDLSGTAANVGGSGSYGILTGGVDVVLPGEGIEPTITVSLGVGAGTPVLTYGYVINTSVNSWTDVNSNSAPSVTPEFNYFGSPYFDYGGFALGGSFGGAGGGFVLYPGKPNTNIMRQVYQK